MADRTSAAGGTAAESRETRTAARSVAGRQSRAARPEQVVVADPPPEPDYPRYRVEPGAGVRLADVDPDESEHFGRKKDAAAELAHHRDRIADLQARLYAENRRSLLLVLQAMDTGGKDGTIKHVFRGVNPQGCQVSSFKAPSAEESAHDFLWRYHQRVPSRGMIGIFNRSHYEDVLVVRVKGLVPEEVWRPRYDVINQFEQALSLSGVTVLKFYLHISRDEQKRRLESRLADPDKRWKFSANDLRERRYWDDYMAAFEEAIANTSTDVAPWYVVPADNKWYRNLVIARTIADTLEAMDPRYPAPEEGLDAVTVED
ncbi:polyphosphate:nucleotide phosphotransferase, PPK2 family [Geodermatophilus dictyosporus]|uniref:Polyphosphate:nucleotide phosphotransferase, PPK2 family n=1 Tax=Geodermatophilus dictyosporus TaxID=1523247 RepID=A0A1I5SYN5_9ACTN|nr:polyphosphate kinase 2 family protein [Geodermatophilus dictyosporus]SFP75879.1 polyphosphate:nucleotide phosphotransferase, PPK2 family [Geodermatophilus dictyosporus]